MKFVLLLLFSPLLVPVSVQSEWWNSMNPTTSMNNIPFSGMESMMRNPQIPLVQFTPPNRADARNMSNIFQGMGNNIPTMPNHLPSIGNNLQHVNPWNSQQNNQRQTQQTPVYQQFIYPTANNARTASKENDIYRYGQPNNQGSYYGSSWTPFPAQQQIPTNRQNIPIKIVGSHAPITAPVSYRNEILPTGRPLPTPPIYVQQ